MKQIYLTNDLMFKHIFGDNENKSFTSDLLESFHNLERNSLKDLEVLNSVKLTLKLLKEKKFEMDVLVRLKNGDIINLEMYNKYNIDAEKKSLLYITKAYGTKTLESGENYKLVRRSIQINFVKDDKVHKDKEIIKKYIIINENNPSDKIIPELFQIYIIDIDQEGEKDYTKINKRFKNWLELLSCENEEQLEKLSKKDKILGEVVEKMKKFAKEDWVQDYESIDRLIRSQHETEMEEAIEETNLSKSIEIAKNLLKKNFSYHDVAEVTELPLEKIVNLAKNMDIK